MLILWWARRDLRLIDNPVLEYAARHNARVVPVYVHAPDEEAPWQPGAANNWWRCTSLQALDQQLQNRNGRLIVRSGSSAETLRALAQKLGADAVMWNRLYEPHLVQRDRGVKTTLLNADIETKNFSGHLLLEPHRSCKPSGEPYRVFTPYWKNAASFINRTSTPDEPPAICWDGQELPSQSPGDLAEFQPEPWHQQLAAHWEPGESAANAALNQFVDQHLHSYAELRDHPGELGTSRLSPHLHFGEISVQRVWNAVTSSPENGSKFLSELGWREFAHHLLWHFPETPRANFNPRFDHYPWRKPTVGDPALRAWQRGRTGIAMVDAAMRELWQCGWMHNRMRMLCGSLLTKNLGIHWHAGAEWFWDTLVDADLANNTQGWQWVAGCGADAAPFFRIFNPDTQAERFDSREQYRRRWLPQGAASVPPMVDLKSSRARALAAYKDNCTGND